MEGASESGQATPIKCVTGVTEQNRSFVNITCIQSVFGNGGTAPDTKLMFKIGGLTNPRFKDFVSEFKLYTMDAQKRYIDENKTPDFHVKMTQLKSITNVEIDVEDKRNGAITNYIIKITPSTHVHNFDVFTIDFPKELVLPWMMTCKSLSPLVGRVPCIKSSNQQRSVEITLKEVASELDSGKVFAILLKGVQNAPTLAPTSPFKNMFFSGRHGNDRF